MQGKAVSEGIAIGTLSIYHKSVRNPEISTYLGSVAEINRLAVARTSAKREIESLRLKASMENNETNVSLLGSYLVMLDDPAFIDAVERRISNQMMTAEQAVESARDRIYELFGTMGDEYMKARAEDIRDISDRVLRNLGGSVSVVPTLNEEVILLADDLTPSDTMQLDTSKVLAFVTRRGSNLSHTAIIARSMNIPAIVGLEYPKDCEGMTAIVDAYNGELIIDPDPDTLSRYRARKAEIEERNRALSELKSLPCVTLDGHRVGLLANVGSVNDIKKAMESGCEGIGLFRSEILYLDREDYPTEEEQYEVYSAAVKAAEGKDIVIRTIDIGADKQLPYMQMKHEDNPALGMRAVRYCLGHKDVFKTQLRAIYRAATHGHISVLIPMIISIEEIWQVRSVINEVISSLQKDGIEYGDCSLGAMIETPAAAVISDLISKEVDFLSIGTNDLTQYTLAVDRQNAELEFICDYHHEAVLRFLNMIIKNGHENGCKICICGELAADTSITGELIRMGVDELSVTPASLLRVKQAIRGIRISNEPSRY